MAPAALAPNTTTRPRAETQPHPTHTEASPAENIAPAASGERTRACTPYAQKTNVRLRERGTNQQHTTSHHNTPQHTTPHHTPPQHTASARTTPHPNTPQYLVTPDTAPQRDEPHHTVPHHTTLHRTTPHQAVPHHHTTSHTAPHRDRPCHTTPHQTRAGGTQNAGNKHKDLEMTPASVENGRNISHLDLNKRIKSTPPGADPYHRLARAGLRLRGGGTLQHAVETRETEPVNAVRETPQVNNTEERTEKDRKQRIKLKLSLTYRKRMEMEEGQRKNPNHEAEAGDLPIHTHADTQSEPHIPPPDQTIPQETHQPTPQTPQIPLPAPLNPRHDTQHSETTNAPTDTQDQKHTRKLKLSLTYRKQVEREGRQHQEQGNKPTDTLARDTETQTNAGTAPATHHPPLPCRSPPKIPQPTTHQIYHPPTLTLPDPPKHPQPQPPTNRHNQTTNAPQPDWQHARRMRLGLTYRKRHTAERKGEVKEASEITIPLRNPNPTQSGEERTVNAQPPPDPEQPGTKSETKKRTQRDKGETTILEKKRTRPDQRYIHTQIPANGAVPSPPAGWLNAAAPALRHLAEHTNSNLGRGAFPPCSTAARDRPRDEISSPQGIRPDAGGPFQLAGAAVDRRAPSTAPASP